MAITPYLLYRDAGAAVDWLAKAFGLRATDEQFKDANGRVNHATLKYGDAVVMLGSPGPDFQSPKAVGHATHTLYVDVTDVDEHYARAVQAGAKIIEEPKETFYGARRYGAEDLEGHPWYFAQALGAKRGPQRKKKASPAKASGRKKAKTRKPRRTARK